MTAPRQIGSGSLDGHVPLKSSEFQDVKERGESFAGSFVVMGILEAKDNQTRLGIVVGRKFDNRAVQRNRARRLIREAFRLLRHGVDKPVWIVAISRKRLKNASIQDVQNDFIKVFKEAGIWRSS
ncbi:MAG: ribonuclease P protein component [Lentisphaeria bacterium]|nr:ribonuclease P protein component [Lentisphaeria bacterium]